MFQNFSKVKWKAFQCVSAAALTINIYLLLKILSNEETVSYSYSSKNYLSHNGFRGYRKQVLTPHPFVHLMSLQNLTERKICTQPKLSLEYDALSFAFYNMTPLQCTGLNLFYMHKGYIVPNKTALGKRQVKSCQVSAIRRDTDKLSTNVFLLDISATKPKLVAEDFLYVKCIFVGDDSLGGRNSQRPGNNLEVLVEEPAPLILKSPSGPGPGKSTTAAPESGSSNYHDIMPPQFRQHLLHVNQTKQNYQNKNKQVDGAVGPNDTLKLKNIATQSTMLEKEKKMAPVEKGLNKIKAVPSESIKKTEHLTEPENKTPLLLAPDVIPILEEAERYFQLKRYDEVENIEDWDELRQDMFYQDLPSCDEEQLLVQVSPRKSVFERARRAQRPKKASGLNVLMFGIDSMSSLTFKRKLPLTLNYLQNRMHAVVFDGYNIVGDGTTQAILPIFVGQLQHEIPGIHNQTLDGLNFVWNDFKRQGYATMFAEDEPHYGVFNLRLGGFENIPTDHYMRYFWQAQRESRLRQDCSQQYCTGPAPNHQFLFEYLKDFFLKYSNISRFAVGFSGELSHDEINPSQYLDSDLVDFIKQLQRRGQLKNTAVIVFSDHGSRRGKVRRTLQGKLEERLPFLAIYLPEDFRKKHRDLYRNMVTNAPRLTSPFDVHETLLDLLNLSRVSTSRRGISLLRPIPANRTCAEAGIETHWCTCVQDTPVPIADPVVKGAVEAVVTTINKLTLSHRVDCVALTLNGTHSAHLILPNTKLLKFHKTEEDGSFTAFFGYATLDMIELQVTLETDRCHGIFEATVQARIQSYDDEAYQGVEIQQIVYHVHERDISRIDTYGRQSACICRTNPQMMKFCCCDRYLKGDKMRSC